jgi:hypothetical protein
MNALRLAPSLIWIVLISCLPLSADYSSGRGEAVGQAIGGGQPFSDPGSPAQQTGPVTYEVGPQTFNSFGLLNGLPTYATASYSGILDNGSTSARASAEVGANNVSLLGDSNSSSRVGFAFQDTLTFSSSTLPFRTPVQYVLTDIIDLSITSTNAGGPDGPNCNYIAFAFSVGTFGQNQISACGGSQELIRNIQQPMTSYVGGQAVFGVQTGVQIYTDSSLKYLQGSGSANSDVLLSILTPGVTYRSDLGFSYSAVPEPGIVKLLCLGVAVLLVARRLHRYARVRLSLGAV